ncbi:YjcB family protein [Rosenbergiella australiborealis]|uniref:YjcB family protein n=1 Tax=Rosenbergiella australiborealis TaxID=1544696 RepID=UPI001F4EEBA3|nr:YjcB family protein [Rosenbergiella australiborealis]
MTTFATSLMIMRWGLVSAGLMYMASAMKIKCQQRSLKAASVAFSGLGLCTSCWFVISLFGIDFTMQNWQSIANVATDAFNYALQQSPDIYISNNL